jgi:hypothetical protein
MGILVFQVIAPSWRYPRLVEGRVSVAGVERPDIPEGETLRVLGSRPAVIDLADRSRLELAPGSEAVADPRTVRLLRGRADFRVAEGLEVATHVGTIDAREAEFTVSVFEDGRDEEMSKARGALGWAMMVAVASGSVEVACDDARRTLTAGEVREFGIGMEEEPTGTLPPIQVEVTEQAEEGLEKGIARLSAVVEMKSGEEIRFFGRYDAGENLVYLLDPPGAHVTYVRGEEWIFQVECTPREGKFSSVWIAPDAARMAIARKSYPQIDRDLAKAAERPSKRIPTTLFWDLPLSGLYPDGDLPEEIQGTDVEKTRVRVVTENPVPGKRTGAYVAVRSRPDRVPEGLDAMGYGTFTGRLVFAHPDRARYAQDWVTDPRFRLEETQAQPAEISFGGTDAVRAFRSLVIGSVGPIRKALDDLGAKAGLPKGGLRFGFRPEGHIPLSWKDGRVAVSAIVSDVSEYAAEQPGKQWPIAVLSVTFDPVSGKAERAVLCYRIAKSEMLK